MVRTWRCYPNANAQDCSFLVMLIDVDKMEFGSTSVTIDKML